MNGDYRAELVLDAYYNMRAAARELNDKDFVSDFDTEDWKKYALSLGSAAHDLDLLLTAGAPLPREWLLGITTP